MPFLNKGGKNMILTILNILTVTLMVMLAVALNLTCAKMSELERKIKELEK